MLLPFFLNAKIMAKCATAGHLYVNDAVLYVNYGKYGGYGIYRGDGEAQRVGRPSKAGSPSIVLGEPE